MHSLSLEKHQQNFPGSGMIRAFSRAVSQQNSTSRGQPRLRQVWILITSFCSVRCPFCNQDNTRVVDSRPVEDTNSIRRRRLCDACGKRFTTYEKVETIPLTVIKKDQNRESYKRSKIQDGVLRACYKRPIPIERVEEMIDSIEGDIFRSEDREISSTKIGEIVMEHLKDLDAVAYVRFASVYREFKDVSTFMDELKKLIN